jgi:hypothetical protein
MRDSNKKPCESCQNCELGLQNAHLRALWSDPKGCACESLCKHRPARVGDVLGTGGCATVFTGCMHQRLVRKRALSSFTRASTDWSRICSRTLAQAWITVE